MFALASLFAFFAITTSATPTLRVRQQGASCVGLADGSTDSPSYNFTLAAVNTTLPNANSTGAPLVLGWGPPGTSPAASAWAISVSIGALFMLPKYSFEHLSRLTLHGIQTSGHTSRFPTVHSIPFLVPRSMASVRTNTKSRRETRSLFGLPPSSQTPPLTPSTVLPYVLIPRGRVFMH